MNKFRNRKIVIFDLDKTITKIDTYIPFILFFLIFRPFKVFKFCLLISPTCKYLINQISDSNLKELYLTEFFKNENQKFIDNLARRFVRIFSKFFLYEDALERIKFHRERGDEIIIASASLDLYVCHFASHLGFDNFLATETDKTSENIITGKLKGPNLKGEKKLHEVKKLLNYSLDYCKIIAYSDDESDIHLLSWVDEGVIINGKEKYIKKSEKINILSEVWR